MQSDTRSVRTRVRHKLILSYGAVTLAAVIIVEALTIGLLSSHVAWPEMSTSGTWAAAVAVSISAAVVAVVLGAWVSRRPSRRLQHALAVTRGWLRGNLALRIDDLVADEPGMLTDQLDLLAEQLEQDEQDLGTLRERNARLTDQVRALAVVEERNRLARELHDSVKQHLFSLAMTASGIRARFTSLQDVPDELVEMVAEVEATALTAQREMTRLIDDLRPVSLSEQGLVAALEDFTLLFGAREHLLIYLEVHGNDRLLHPSLSETLHLVAQEALHNVARHARATRVDVHLRCIPEQVALTIRDNGVGFDPSQARRGLGLPNMQQRMLAVGGRLVVDSRRGAGTTVMAEAGLARPLGVSPSLPQEKREQPRPMIDNWAWLGQRLVIPVGQTWPWLPADQVHLRGPLVESSASPLTISRSSRFLGLASTFDLQLGHRPTPLVRAHPSRSGWEWEADDASWAVRRIRGLSGRMVLTRNGQPLAAVQYQGRLLNSWREIIYDGRGYRLVKSKQRLGRSVLVDETNEEAFVADVGDPSHIVLRRALPLPLLLLTAMCLMDEAALTSTSGGVAEPQDELQLTP
ncbi:MAG TPA: sensor histidine kinase [Anaerolineae bacterium]|nr:sensor histidine kinase [Anaerolineae bacterium]